MVTGGAAGGKAADVTQDQVADELLRLLERAGGAPADITPATPLAALYLDSVDHAEIREALHDRFGIEIDMAELATARTVVDAGLSCPVCLGGDSRIDIGLHGGEVSGACSCAGCEATWSLALGPQQLL